MRMYRVVFVLCVALALQACAARDAALGIARKFSTAAGARPADAPAQQSEVSLYFNLVDGLIKQQRCGAALAFLNSYAAEQKILTPRYWLLRGNALLGLGNYGEASFAYKKLDVTPLAAEGWNGQGRVAADQQKWRVAADDFRKAIQGSPSNPNFLNNLAFAQMHFGETAASTAYLRQAYELAPNSDLIRNNLIIALTLSGNSDGANAILQNIHDRASREEVRAIILSVIDKDKLTRDRKS